jgi:hypothetical protein
VKFFRRGAIGGIAATAVLAFAGIDDEARATTFCVPGFHAACPNSGGNVAEADLEKAMGLNATDGVADQIIVAAGTFTENNAYEPEAGSGVNTFEPKGSDPLTITGASPASTVMTSSAGANVYLVNLSYNNSRKILIRDLTVQVPAAFPDGEGSGILLYNGDTLDNVDVASLNKGSDGVSAGGVGNVFRNGELRGGEGLIGDGFKVNSGNSALLVEDATVKGASWGLVASAMGASLTARRVNEVGTRTYGAIATNGALSIENSKMTLNDATSLYVSAATTDTSLTVDHLTAVNSGGTDPALEGKKFATDAGNASLAISNSILRGFASGYKIESAIGPGIGVVSIKARYSNLRTDGSNGSGSVDFATGNIDVDPLLAADYSLPPKSPSVDAGDPAVGGLVTDFLGALRPADGNGDGIARRDQGAFEYQPPVVIVDPPPGGGGSGPAPDTTAPETTIVKGPGAKLAKGKAKFSLASSEPGSRFECKLDGRKAAACKSPKRYSGLKPGRHTFRAWATDAAGNKDPTPAKRSFRVPAA